MRLDWVGPMCLSWDEIARVPPKIGGVYILHAFEVDFGSYPAFYVGQSGNLRRRLGQHLSGTSPSGQRLSRTSARSAQRQGDPV